MIQTLSLLGSTGSIGTQTLEIVRTNKDIKITALAAGNNIELLEKQIREFKPSIAAVWNEEKAAELKIKTADLDVEILSGMDGLLAAASWKDSQIVVTAIVGMIGILPTIEGIKAGKDIALANKETLVTAGHIIMPLAKEYGVSILPVDSEHSAIFQSLQGEPKAALDKILLTASGGPFRGKSAEFLETVTLEAALNHPNWSMGPKITIDSSTMVNKGLDYFHCKGCLRCVEICPTQALIKEKEKDYSVKPWFIPNIELKETPDCYEKTGADGYITSEAFLDEKRIEGGEV